MKWFKYENTRVLNETTKSLIIIINLNVNHSERSTLEQHIHIYIPKHIENWFIPCVSSDEKWKREGRQKNHMSSRRRSQAHVHCANPFRSYIYTHINNIWIGCGCQECHAFIFALTDIAESALYLFLFCVGFVSK